MVASRLHEEEKTLQILQSGKPMNGLLSLAASQAPVGQAAPENGKEPHFPEEEAQPTEDSRTLIERMFGGRLSTGIRCTQCNSISQKEEPFTDLSLAFCPSSSTTTTTSSSSSSSSSQKTPSEEPKGLGQGSVNGGSEAPELQGPGKSSSVTVSGGGGGGGGGDSGPATNEPPLSVPDLVNYFLAPEILDEENAYFCDTCSSLQRAERTMEVVAAPEYLILTLLRFSYDAKCHVRRKILDNVTMPPLMTLPLHSPPPSPSPHRPPAAAASSSSSLCTITPPPPPPPPPAALQVDSPESSENLAKKLKPSHKEEEEEQQQQQQEEEEEDEEVEVVEEEQVQEETGRTDGAEQMEGDGRTVSLVPYVLSSVVMHSGTSSESGHYYSYGRSLGGKRRPEAGLEAGPGSAAAAALTKPRPTQAEAWAGGAEERRDWMLFNDSRVSFTSFQSVQNVTDRFPKDTAYVLVYRKQEASAPATGRGGAPNGMSLSAEPPLQKELLDAITKDNKLYLQVRPAKALECTEELASFAGISQC